MTVKIINGHALEELKKLKEESVDCIITSPPYYALRSYKGAETIWGGDPACEHEFAYGWHKPRGGGDPVETTLVGNNRKHPHFEYDSTSCIRCGAWKGQLGLEPTYQMYLDHLLMITAELKRVLKKTGTLFWNMGDSYAGNMGKRQGWNDNELTYTRDEALKNGTSFYLNADYGNIQDKSLMMLPERFAIGMIDQGWTLRNKIIWYKVNGMPSCLSPDTEIYLKGEDDVISPHTLADLMNLNIEKFQILTPFGWKKIKSIWKVKKREYIKFQFGSSGEVVCSLDHRFPISHDNRRKNYKIELAQNLREDKHRSLNRLLFVPIGHFLDGKYKEIDGEKLDYELGRFIGLIVAEGGFNAVGSNQGKITLNKNENDLMEFFTGVLTKRFHQYFKIYQKDNYQSVQFSSKIIKSLYQKLVFGKGITKSLNMTYILNFPLEFRQGLFDGIIAGDGYIDKNGRTTYGTGSRQLRDDVYLLASSIGLLVSRYKPHKRYDKRTDKVYTGYYLTIPLSLQKEFLKGEIIQNGNYNTRIKAPVPNVYENIFSCKTLKISNIEKIKQEKEFIDIEVEGGLFLINGGLVSHNSVKDRFANKWEYIFFFVKSKKYFFDLDAVRKPLSDLDRMLRGVSGNRDKAKDILKLDEYDKHIKEEYKSVLPLFDKGANPGDIIPYHPKGDHGFGIRLPPQPNQEHAFNVNGVNPGDFLNIPTRPHTFAHFAVYPVTLIAPLIKAGCPSGGTVLDPFAGSGTTGVVAEILGRNSILIEISKEYIDIINFRLQPENLEKERKAILEHN